MNLIGLFQVIFHLFRFRLIWFILFSKAINWRYRFKDIEGEINIIAITGVGTIFLIPKNIKKIIKYIYFKVLTSFSKIKGSYFKTIVTC